MGSENNPQYKIPEGTRIYAIGDVHGYVHELEAMHRLIEADIEANPVDDPQIVYIGDYIDRGPESAQVIQCLMDRELNAPHIQHRFLMGNHENAMIEFMKSPQGPRKDWLDWGGIYALASYDVYADMDKPLSGQVEMLADKLKEKVPAAHMEFLNNLDLMYVCGDYVFVHAGIVPHVPLHKQKKQDLIMIRQGFLDNDIIHEKRVVHGHTSVSEIEIKPSRINVDTGLYFGRHLTAAVLEGDAVRDLRVIMMPRRPSSVLG